MRKLTLLIILVAAAAVVLPQEMRMPMPKTSSAQSDAQKAFEKLKTLAGSWQGSVMGMSVLFDITGYTEKGFMNRIAFTIVDANHHNEESTFMLPGNKSFRAGGVLQRTK